MHSLNIYSATTKTNDSAGFDSDVKGLAAMHGEGRDVHAEEHLCYLSAVSEALGRMGGRISKNGLGSGAWDGVEETCFVMVGGRGLSVPTVSYVARLARGS